MGLGCGNPQAIAALQPGETVLDLGSGGGFDCSRRQPGRPGRASDRRGHDPEMIAKARENARKINAANVEFRLGEIEHLPVADATADVILSNCVINLSRTSPPCSGEAYPRPAARRPALRSPTSSRPQSCPPRCAAGRRAHRVRRGGDPGRRAPGLLQHAGFTDIRIGAKPQSREFIRGWVPGSGAEQYVTSATIEALKPARPEARA